MNASKLTNRVIRQEYSPDPEAIARLLRLLSSNRRANLERTIAHQDRHAAGVREVVVSSGDVLFAVAVEVAYDCRVRIRSHPEGGRGTKTAVAIAEEHRHEICASVCHG